jgi:hypothetical protein
MRKSSKHDAAGHGARQASKRSIQTVSSPNLFAQTDRLASAAETLADMVTALRAEIYAAWEASGEGIHTDVWMDAFDSAEVSQKATRTAAKHLQLLARRLRLAIPS